MQSLEELARATAEINIANPHWNATQAIETEVKQAAVNIQGVVSAVVALFPDIFPTGLPAKYFMHARMAVLSRAWGMDGQSVLCPIADLFNHEEPTHVVISIQKKNRIKREGQLDAVEVILNRTATKGEEVFNGRRRALFCDRLFLRGYFWSIAVSHAFRFRLRSERLHPEVCCQFRLVPFRFQRV